MAGRSLQRGSDRIARWYAARETALQLEPAYHEYLHNILADDWRAQAAWELSRRAYRQLLLLGRDEALVLSLTIQLKDSAQLATAAPTLRDVQDDLHGVTPPGLAVWRPTPAPLWSSDKLEEYRRTIEDVEFLEVDDSVQGVYVVTQSRYDCGDPEPYVRRLTFERFPGTKRVAPLA